MAGASNNLRLTDQHLGLIATELSAKQLKMVSVVYGMGIKQHELDDISDDSDPDGVKRKILIKWRNRSTSNNKQAGVLLKKLFNFTLENSMLKSSSHEVIHQTIINMLVSVVYLVEHVGRTCWPVF